MGYTPAHDDSPQPAGAAVTGQAPALLVTGAALALTMLLALLCDARRQVRRERAENNRLRARLATFTRILAPLPDAVRSRRAVVIPPHDLTVLALLIEQEGRDGDEIAALELLLHQPSGTLDALTKYPVICHHRVRGLRPPAW